VQPGKITMQGLHPHCS